MIIEMCILTLACLAMVPLMEKATAHPAFGQQFTLKDLIILKWMVIGTAMLPAAIAVFESRSTLGIGLLAMLIGALPALYKSNIRLAEWDLSLPPGKFNQIAFDSLRRGKEVWVFVYYGNPPKQQKAHQLQFLKALADVDKKNKFPGDLYTFQGRQVANWQIVPDDVPCLVVFSGGRMIQKFNSLHFQKLNNRKAIEEFIQRIHELH